MKIKYKNILTLLSIILLIIPGVIFAGVQQDSGNFKGVVVGADNQPLSGVLVKVQEKSIQETTDTNGKFEISVLVGDYLIFEKEGYISVIKRYSGQDMETMLVLNKQLAYEDNLLDIGYGNQSKRSFVGAVSTISSSTIEKNGVSSIEEAINGSISGLYSLKNGGYKYGLGNRTFYVRGVATNANATPLILVDDMEANIDMIDYTEIESVTVLKDAAALAIYGMRGANGVILIKTKRGSAFEDYVKLDVRTGIQQSMNVAGRLNAYQYSTLYNEALVNDGQSPMYTPDVYLGDYNKFVHPDVNFKDEFLKSSSPYQHYVFSSKGGNNVAKYYVTAGYLKQEGLFKDVSKNSSYERFNFRSNVDINIGQGLTVGARAYASISNNRVPYRGMDANSTINNVFNAIITTPANAYPIFNEDGSLGGTADYMSNLYGVFNRAGQRTDNTRIMNMAITAKQDLSMLLPGLSIDGYFGFENFNSQYNDISHTFSVSELQSDGTYLKLGEDKPQKKYVTGTYGSFYRYMTYGIGANYNTTFGDRHAIMAKLLFSQSSQTLTGDNPDIVYQGLAFRGTYAYDNKYYGELTASYQGSNNYKSGDRFGLFPAVGLGWIISEEDFLKGNSSINFAKIRATYGVNGNDQTNSSRFPYRQVWSASGGYSFGATGSTPEGSQEGTLSNPGEKWEKAYKLNVGADLKLFSDLELSVDYFHEKRKDILVNLSNLIPSLIGINLPLYNGGQINNSGLELSLGYSKKVGAVELFASGNILWAKNKIIDLKETAYQYDYMYLKGHSVGTRFGYQTNGMYTSQDQLANAPTSQFGTPSLGDLIYVNQNADDDNVISTLDQVAIGNAFPEFIYGITLGANYKGFDFAATFEGVGDYDVYWRPNQFSQYAYDNRWTPANANVATAYPRLSIASSYNTQSSDFWQDSGRSFSISSVELGYTIPQSLINKIKLNSLRVFVNGNNLYTFSNTKDGRNPQALNAGYSQYPLLRTWTIGLSVKL